MSKDHWFKSSRSTGDDPNCIEVRFTDRGVDVRDSKDLGGPFISTSPQLWQAFLQKFSDE
jgi:hypothetical protein